MQTKIINSSIFLKIFIIKTIFLVILSRAGFGYIFLFRLTIDNNQNIILNIILSLRTFLIMLLIKSKCNLSEAQQIFNTYYLVAKLQR